MISGVFWSAIIRIFNFRILIGAKGASAQTGPGENGPRRKQAPAQTNPGATRPHSFEKNYSEKPFLFAQICPPKKNLYFNQKPAIEI